MAISISDSGIKAEVDLSAEFKVAALGAASPAEPQLNNAIGVAIGNKEMSTDSSPQELAIAMPKIGSSRAQPQSCGGSSGRPCATIGIRG